MADMNKVFLLGKLTKDPELRFLHNGQSVANLRLALNRRYKTSGGERKEEVTYVGVEVWGGAAEACGEHLRKGSQALIEGRLKLKEWTTDGGEKRSVLEVVADRVQFIGGNVRAESDGDAMGGR